MAASATDDDKKGCLNVFTNVLTYRIPDPAGTQFDESGFRLLAIKVRDSDGHERGTQLRAPQEEGT